MTTAGETATGFATATLDELARDTPRAGRQRMPIRRHFDIRAFGCNAYRADEGVDVISEHDELGPSAGGHEELYLVASGHATFTVDGEELDAPAGTLVYVKEPSLKRKAVARESGTTVLVLGGKPGQVFAPSPWEAMSDMWPPYQAGDYATALAAVEGAAQEHPDSPVVFFNLACCESLLGRTDDAIEHLRTAVRDDRLRAQAARDSDLDAIRDDPRFRELVPEVD